MFDYYGQVLQSLNPGIALFFGTLIAGKMLVYAVQQLKRAI